MFVETRLKYRNRQGEEKTVISPDLSVVMDDLEIRALYTETPVGEMINLKLFSAEPVELIDFVAEAWIGIDPAALMMVNGFQSWSLSGEMGKEDSIKPVSSFSRFATGPYGDYNIHKYSGKPGKLHSWTYTYFRSEVQPFFLLGSADESSGYTVFDYDFNSGTLLIRRDCLGASVKSGIEYNLLNLYMGKGKEKELFGDYFARWKLPRESVSPCTGWTSWYNYYTNISEAVLEDNLEAVYNEKLPIDVFQIDDGYQRAVGDWKEVNEKFPSGMSYITGLINEKGYKPGLWMAPFICEQNSWIFQNKPEWLLRDEKGRPVKAGWNPSWSGFFYALNIYQEEFRDYLKEVFDKVINEWGFKILKLDFLYAAGILPVEGRSRGQVMCEAMDFLRDISPDIQLLGCGVPLGPSFGKVDYCRIGSDVGPYWDFKLLSYMNVRERISTVNSLKSTIGRRHLDGFAFRNDPDVFIMRDGTPKVNYNKLNEEQRYTLFLINNLMGSLVFFSDNINEYSTEQLETIKQAYPVPDKIINEVKKDNDFYRIKFSVNRKDYLVLVNLGNKPYLAEIVDEPYFNPSLFMIKKGSFIEIAPYQSICLKKVDISNEKPFLMGASGHIFPGSQIDKFVVRKDNVMVKLLAGSSKESKIFIALPFEIDILKVNGVDYPVSSREGFYYVTVNPELKGEKIPPKAKKKKPINPKKQTSEKSTPPKNESVKDNKK